MPPIKRYEWLCLRAIKSRHLRAYSTTETSTTDQSTNDAVPLESSQEPPPDGPDDTTISSSSSSFSPTHLRSFLEKQDTLTLKKLHTHFLKLQSTTKRSRDSLLSYRTLSSVQGHPSLPPYTLHRNTKPLTDADLATSLLQSRTQNILDNIEDLQNMLYPYEKGATPAEKFRERLRGLNEVAKTTERMEAKNVLDGEKKRFQQRIAGLEGLVDDMRRSVGKEGLRMSSGFGSTFGVRKPVKKEEKEKEKGQEEESKAKDGDATAAGTGKVKAEVEDTTKMQVSTDMSTTSETTDDTIGTAKVEAHAEATKTSSTSPPEPQAEEPPTKTKSLPPSPYISFTSSFSPMDLAEAEAAPAAPATPQSKPATKPAKAQSDAKVLRNIHRATSGSVHRLRSPGITANQMQSLIASLKSETEEQTLDQGEGAGEAEGSAAGYGQSATQIEEKKDPDEKTPNPFARFMGKL